MSVTMSQYPDHHELPPSDHLHPSVYIAIASLVLLFVVSAFVSFAGREADYLLAVVTGFFVIVMAIPYLLWRVWRRHGDTKRRRKSGCRTGLRAILRPGKAGSPVAKPQSRVLLPIAAVAFGMTAIGIVLLLVAHHLA